MPTRYLPITILPICILLVAACAFVSNGPVSVGCLAAIAAYTKFLFTPTGGRVLRGIFKQE
jgi:hypothetical protein